MDAFTIKDLENLTGIKAHTIRIWEQRYTFLKPRRTGTNIRYYNGEELKMLLNVALLNKYGFKISHISRMTGQQVSEKVVSLAQVEAVNERTVNDLVARMIDIGVEEFEHIINHCISTRGIEKTVANIIFPLLEKIGILWHTSRIIPAQEHLVSNIIRQKLIVGIENAVFHPASNKSAVLFLPESEYHEIGLLYMHYQFKTRGYTVFYLGANTPLADVGYIAVHKKPDFVYTHIISTPPNFNFDKFLASYVSSVGRVPLVITGKYAKAHKKNIPPSVHLKYSLSEVFEYTGAL